MSTPISGITIGSKNYTENVILGEIINHYLSSAGIESTHRKNLGGTRILWDALIAGDIDIYPEYTGTLMHEIFSDRHINHPGELEPVLRELGIGMSLTLGFNNTYVLGMLESNANALNIHTISDITRYPELRLGLSNEFLARGDGWYQLKSFYDLPHENVVGIDHDLAYRGIENQDIDIMDLYSTDAEIEYYKIKPIIDDQGFFPGYLAIIIYRNELIETYPDIRATLNSMEGRINEQQMVSMNAAVKLQGETEARVAASFLERQFDIRIAVDESSAKNNLLKNTLDHLTLVIISLSAAILLSVPLGIIAAKKERAGQLILGVAGVFQTIPALALLVFMIPLFGIGSLPAIVALFFYSLLPIIRNTSTGIKDIPSSIIESSKAIGLPEAARIRLIELPLAMRSIISGIKISAVINIGTATLGALIGAGGYGQPIITGIRLNDIGLILEGAIPAAFMALLFQAVFELLEKRFIPKGLQ